jgi:hypothetical protein
MSRYCVGRAILRKISVPRRSITRPPESQRERGGYLWLMQPRHQIQRTPCPICAVPR